MFEKENKLDYVIADEVSLHSNYTILISTSDTTPKITV